ncbi:MAG: dual specificity protein phosphatase [Hydrocarboniphaga sp.]|uniref:phosphatase domain-containing putative toxin n=1 Tax=Hydrocarboniphaga sp. TaxID=2033016 RepID=UPI00262DA830|nr:dual specificity protein phosphatase family protein [Hydrocarboniphaga sp.]MDB5967985.1 dual specificity protein phosphatase [Hydrocarboniphaga sp.]
MQLLIGQVRYAVHTLLFEEANPLQKRWALFAASAAAAQFRRKIPASVGLRIDWLLTMAAGDARVGLTWLPGRKNVGRILEESLDALRASSVTSVICLLARDEFARYGVEGLLDAYRARGIDVLHTPTLDGRSPSATELHESVACIRERFEQKRNVVIHCVGGIGRAGTVASCWLKSRGFTTDNAIAKVREI